MPRDQAPLSDLFSGYQYLPPPDRIGDPAGNVDHRLIFSSGMQCRGDYEAALRAGHTIGIDIQFTSQNAMNGIARELAQAWGAHLFVDSGAFSAFRSCLRGKPRKIDFDKVFEKYERLALAVSLADESCSASHRVHYVMPDVVGDQVASLALLERYAEQVRDWFGFNAIIPIQGGSMSLTEFFDAVVAIIGRDDIVIGVPSQEQAVDNDELAALLAARPSIYGVHVLGAASEKRGAPRVAVIRAAGFDGHVSMDANRLRGHWNKWCVNRAEARDRLLAGLPAKRKADCVNSA